MSGRGWVVRGTLAAGITNTKEKAIAVDAWQTFLMLLFLGIKARCLKIFLPQNEELNWREKASKPLTQRQHRS